jgi:hypothetical protein
MALWLIPPFCLTINDLIGKQLDMVSEKVPQFWIRWVGFFRLSPHGSIMLCLLLSVRCLGPREQVILRWVMDRVHDLIMNNCSTIHSEGH